MASPEERRPKRAPPERRMWIWTAAPRSVLMEPERPAVVRTLASLMRVAPKSARGMIWQPASADVPWQADGASMIHSAELGSMALANRVLVKALPVVRLESRRRARWPVTTTLAAMWSPGWTRRRALCETSG